MDNIVLIEEGVKFLVLGMTTVYIFLYLMVIVLKIESKLVQKYFPPAKKPPSPAKKSQIKTSNEDEVVAAITAAITEHRKK
jgi:oxaloacetate decarboxylase gamma subunit